MTHLPTTIAKSFVQLLDDFSRVRFKNTICRGHVRSTSHTQDKNKIFDKVQVQNQEVRTPFSAIAKSPVAPAPG
jgi:hypothetical protein